MMELPPELLLGGGAVGVPALTYYAVKAAINGMRADVREIKADVKTIRGKVQDNAERISKVEATSARTTRTN